MTERNEIIKQLALLPKGYLSKKKIHGKIRYYLQWKENGVLKSKYIKEEVLPKVQEQLQEREKLLSQLKQYQSQKRKPLATLGLQSRSLTGNIMAGNDKVASFEKGVLLWMDDKKAPLLIKNTGDLSLWLSSRSLDSSRSNARRLKAYLGFKNKDEVQVSLTNRSLSLTDDYWFRVKGSKLKYKDILFDNDDFCELALEGKLPSLKTKPSLTPELTSLGSFEKGWKLIDHQWWLIKKGNPMELFSEWFASMLASKLALPTVSYILERDTIRSKNFASDTNLELLSSLAYEDDSYQHIFTCLKPYGKEILSSYLYLMWFDCLIFNVDRHTENMGLLRDRKTGAILSLAPNFDNNMALFAAMGTLPSSRKQDGLIKSFSLFLQKNKETKELYSTLKLPVVDKNIILSILEDSPISVDKEALIHFLEERSLLLKDLQL